MLAGCRFATRVQTIPDDALSKPTGFPEKSLQFHIIPSIPTTMAATFDRRRVQAPETSAPPIFASEPESGPSRRQDRKPNEARPICAARILWVCVHGLICSPQSRVDQSSSWKWVYRVWERQDCVQRVRSSRHPRPIADSVAAMVHDLSNRHTPLRGRSVSKSNSLRSHPTLVGRHSE